MNGRILVFTVTNDLNYDQRMIRICGSLAKAGYNVLLIGRKVEDSTPLAEMPFRQQRLRCLFNKGFLFYAEYNIRLFFYLLFRKTDLICAIDLDTILACYLVSAIKNLPRVYDAHELFCEMKEVVTRPFIYRCWKTIERSMVPRFPKGYTVNNSIASEFRKMYGVEYGTIRNMPRLLPLDIPEKHDKYILYQGAVNEGRCFETLIPTMRYVEARLIICGGGNFLPQARQLVIDNSLQKKILFKGKLSPTQLRQYTIGAWVGVNLIENTGLSNYLSLANRFFDYLHAGLPQVCVNYPAYEQINHQYEVARLISDCTVETIAAAINELLTNDDLYSRLQNNCMIAREALNWEMEEKNLLDFYRDIFSK